MVAPVRWATPGTEVVCARYPEFSARSTIQSASTPPPSPPMARMAMLIDRAAATLAPEEADCDSWLMPILFCQIVMRASRRSIRRCRRLITAFLNLAFIWSHALGFEITSARKKDGHNLAACATSPHTPQPMQLSKTVATGSVRSKSGLGWIVSDGQPERRMQE